jgi:hypothetical protein
MKPFDLQPLQGEADMLKAVAQSTMLFATFTATG